MVLRAIEVTRAEESFSSTDQLKQLNARQVVEVGRSFSGFECWGCRAKPGLSQSHAHRLWPGSSRSLCGF